MGYFEKGGTGYSVLYRLRNLNPYWTLHAGGSLVYHLNHRKPGDLDFFCEHAVWSEAIADFTANTIIPNSFPDAPGLRKQAIEAWRNPGVGSFKLHFEKVTLSFIRFPRVIGTLRRVQKDNLLAVASLEDSVALKLNALACRHVYVDYRDWVTILRECPIGLQEIIKIYIGSRHLYPEPHDPGVCLTRLGQMPEHKEGLLSLDDVELLKSASAEGLRLLGR